MLMSSGPDGLEIFKAIRARRPSQKAIITSGFSETDRVKEALRLGASGYLKKPFISKELGALLHSALRQDVLAIHPLT
jgi:two-component system cell cycle sensor histidine kinase/response regulator CckA